MSGVRMILAMLELAPAAAHHPHGHQAGAAWAAVFVVMISVLTLWTVLDMARGPRDDGSEADGDEP